MRSLLLLVITLIGSSVFGQITATPNPINNVDDTVSLIVDMNLTDCTSLTDDPGPMYLFAWTPSDPVGGNGPWNASNPALQMTNIGPNLWEFVFVPSELFADVSDIFSTGISFLVKKSDGGSGGDCNNGEFKTENFNIPVRPEEEPLTKISSFPTYIEGDTLLRMDFNDVFTIIYDNKQEDKPSMQNQGALFVYAKATFTDGSIYEVSTVGASGSNPSLAMLNEGNGIFSFSCWPDRLFVAPSGHHVQKMEFRILKPNAQFNEDAVDGTFGFTIGCQ